MERMFLTCPFTGVEFQAYKDAKLQRLYYANPIEHETMSVNYDPSTNSITINLNDFNHVELVTPEQATDILAISRQRIYQIINDNVINAHTIAGRPFLKLCEVLDYKQNRKPGRPRKAE